MSIPELQPGPRKAALGFIFVAVMLDMIALGVVVTVLPSLLQDMVGPAEAGFMNGVFVSVWALMQFFFSPVLGALSDRFGRRPVLLLSMAGLGLDYVVMALAPNLAWLLIGRIASGITASNITTAYAYVADVTTEEKRAGGFGLIGAGFGMGFILGPLLGGVLGELSPRAPFWAAAALCLANVAFGVFVLPESLPRSLRAPFSLKKANPLGALSLLRGHRELFGLAAVNFASQFAGASMPTLYVLYAVQRYGWSLTLVGVSLAAVGLGAALVQGLLAGRLTERFGERAVFVGALAAGAVGTALFGLSADGVLFYVGIPLIAIWGLANPAGLALMSRRVDASEQGRLQGANMSVLSIAEGVAPFLLGAIYAWSVAQGRTQPGLAFLFAAAVQAAATLLAIWIVRRDRPSPAAAAPS